MKYKAIKRYLIIESKMFFREPLQVVFSFIFPAAMFSIFASIFTGNLKGSQEYFNTYIPGYFTTVIFIVAMFMVGYQMVVDKEMGIYRRLKATPFKLKDVYKAMIIKTIILCTIGFLEIIIIAKLVFNANITTYWGQFMIVFIIGNVVASASGFVIFSLCNTSKGAMSAIILSFYPLVMLGDNTFPLNMMPGFLQKVAPIINPLYHLNRILRGAWIGKLTSEYISLLYVICTIFILGGIAYVYDKSTDDF